MTCSIIFYIFVLLPYISAGPLEKILPEGRLEFHPVSSPWHQARLRCSFEGGVLASPWNNDFLTGMQELITSAKVPFVFTGIHSTFSPGDYTSVEGTPLSEMPIAWMKAEPNAGSSDNMCLYMSSEGKIGDRACSEMLPYMCYKQNPKVQINSNEISCGSAGYTYEPLTDSCYKVHVHGRTWSRGYMTCLAEGAHLAIINSETEAQVIRKIFARYPESSMQADYTHVASIGYSDWGEHGLWWTIHEFK